MGGRSRKLRIKARRQGKPVAKGRAMIGLGVGDTASPAAAPAAAAPAAAIPKKKKAAKKK